MLERLEAVWHKGLRITVVVCAVLSLTYCVGAQHKREREEAWTQYQQEKACLDAGLTTGCYLPENPVFKRKFGVKRRTSVSGYTYEEN